jgi:hypothetical protein
MEYKLIIEQFADAVAKRTASDDTVRRYGLTVRRYSFDARVHTVYDTMKTAGQMVDGDVSRNIILPQCNKPLTRN